MNYGFTGLFYSGVETDKSKYLEILPETPLRSWHALASRAIWKTPADIKAAYGNASFTGNNRVVFNIKGNDYRLMVAVRYDKRLMYVRFVGTHRQYDKIDVETI